MKRVCVVCEGQTEETFVRNVLAPSFYDLDLNLTTEMIETSPGHKGGALNYDRVKRHLRNTLRQNSAPFVTTLFDLYKLDSRFPSFQEAKAKTDLASRLTTLTEALHADIVAEAGCLPSKFIPYIQPYEFESLLFSDVSTLVEIEPGWQRAKAALTAIRSRVSSPEHINDSPETKPAAHLERELTAPKYRKQRHGPLATQRIGLQIIESECSFFAGWLHKIRELAQG